MSKDVHYGAFSWDEEKERANIRIHGLNFHDAAEAFADPRRIIARDGQHSQHEDRLFCIGYVGNRVATVRFTYRGKMIRIFGAGFWRKGRKAYEETRS